MTDAHRPSWHRRSAAMCRRADEGVPPPTVALEEAHGLGAVAHQHVLGLLIAIQHLLMGFAAEAGFLITAERGACRIHVIAVGPAAAGFDGAAHTVAIVDVARPHAGAQAVGRIVTDGDGFVERLESSRRDDRTEDLLLQV